MIRFSIYILLMVLLFSLELGFIYSLPSPFNAIPLVLVFTVFLYQYKTQTLYAWLLVCFGYFLDLFGVSFAPFEIVSYSLATIVMMFVVEHVFTNKSFYGMTATSFLCLLTLLLSRLSFMGISSVFGVGGFYWQEIFILHVWSVVFAALLLLFVFPSAHQFFLRARRVFYQFLNV